MADHPIVDMHAHILTRDMPRHDPTGSHPLHQDYPATRYLAEMDAAGVHYGVMAASSRVGAYNDAMIRALRQHPRLRATVILPPDTDFFTFERLDAEGVVGVRLSLRELGDLPDLSSRAMQHFLHRIRDFGWHVHVHLDAARLGEVLPQLLRVGVKVVIDHFGRPQGEDDPDFAHVLAAIAAGGVWVKLSAPYRLAASSAAVNRYAARLLAEGGPEHLLWASDWPFTGGFETRRSYAEAVDDLIRWIPRDEDRQKVFSKNALRLLGI